MAGLTKDELKTALVNHGVEIPLSTLKKDELVGLYDAYVAPHDLGEFSSDDEAVQISPQKVTKKVSRTSTNKSTATNGESKTKSANLTEENSMIVGEIKVDELSDEKLAKYLKDFGIEVGPIVDSTRSLYMKKLAIVMREQAENQDQPDNAKNDSQNGHTEVNGKSDANGSHVENEKVLDKSLGEYSADEEINSDDEQPAVVVKQSTRASVTPKKTTSTKKSPLQSLGASIRQRFSAASPKSEQKEDRFTPTPRRSIHSYKVTESSKKTLTKHKDGSISEETEVTKVTSEDAGVVEPRKNLKTLFKILPGVFLLMILAALVYYVGLRRK